ncbi:MAG: hypothetical protein KIS92_09210 [Planctomycetota bacterium]|nr:hypothetical protein [Planctomycetota bacterium]
MSEAARDVPSYRQGRTLSGEMPDALQELLDDSGDEVSWRGWVLGLLTVAGITVLEPLGDFVLQSTWFSSNALPVLPIAILFGLVLAMRGLQRALNTTLGFTRNDLVLVFCMALVTYALPGTGFWSFWTTQVTAPYFYATETNGWAKSLHPYLTEGFFLRDPSAALDNGPRPVEWLYNGLPPGRSIPYAAWAGPFARWYVVLMLMFGAWLSMSLLLFRRWSNLERLPFPVAEVPVAILKLFPAKGDAPAESSDGAAAARRMFWVGLAAVFALHLWNGLAVLERRIPPLPMLNWNLNWRLFTESPYREMGALHFHVYPAVIGLTFLLSLDVAFSVWFFYVLRKLFLMIVGVAAGAALSDRAVQGQGTGALLMLAVYALWMARAELGQSLRAAMGRSDEPPGDRALPARALWSIFGACALGVTGWMAWAGIGFGWGVLLVALMVLVAAGLSRLVVEAGLVATQLYDFPSQMLSLGATPAVMGSGNYVMARAVDRVFANDWFRIVPMANILNGFQVAAQTRLRQSSALAGMALALCLTMGLGFFTFLGTTYTNGGAKMMGFYMADSSNNWTRGEIPGIAQQSASIQNWEKKEEAARAEGREPAESERPEVARRDWWHIGWMGIGSLAMLLMSLVRRYVFWFPHPAGYVMWMSSFPHDCLWASFFIGWLAKWLIAKFGGMRAYGQWRYFFVGMVAGEAAAALFWGVASAFMSQHFSYVIRSG